MSEQFFIVGRMINAGLKPNEISYILFGDYTGKDKISDQLGFICDTLKLEVSESLILYHAMKNKVA